MPLPSAPAEGTAAGAAAAAAGQKRQREEESGEFTFRGGGGGYNRTQPNTRWKQRRMRRWMLRMMTTSLPSTGNSSVLEPSRYDDIPTFTGI